MEKAKASELVLLFIDASHFVMGGDFIGHAYGKIRRYIRTFSGRMRYNVLGALNFATKQMTCVTNDTYIRANEVCELLQKLAVEYADQPIYIVLDNARYQKCKIVQETAAQLGIFLVYIPPYSPNLNLIERLWKHVKGRLRTKYYNSFERFKGKIDTVLSATENEDKKAIDRLISDKVQLFDNLLVVDDILLRVAS